jgi:hypothetical protein
MTIRELRLSEYIAEEPNAAYVNDYEQYYFNLCKLVTDMSDAGVQQDIASIDDTRFDDADFDINENTWLRKIRRWLKHSCGQDNFFGKDTLGDLPWVADIIVGQNRMDEYLSVFIQNMKLSRDNILENWAAAIGYNPLEVIMDVDYY